MPSSLPLVNDTSELSAIEGVMEGPAAGWFSGWLWNTKDLEDELWVEIVGPGLYERVKAADHRPDLAAAGKRDGNCWFKASVPASLTAQARIEIVALVAGTSHRLRLVEEGDRTPEEHWLDRQPQGLRTAVNAQRVRAALHRAPLTEQQLASLPEEAGTDLYRLVGAAAQLPG